MADMNYDGTICADKVYTEQAIKLILHISQDQLNEYYREGLSYYERTRQQDRLISGACFHRFVERLSVPCPEENDAKAGASTPA